MVNLDFLKRVHFHEFYFHFIYLRNWLLSFGISNSFWDLPLFGLGGSLGITPLREGENHLV